MYVTCSFILMKIKSFSCETNTRSEKETNSHSEVEVKPAYEPTGLSGRRLSRFLWHEATRSISKVGPGYLQNLVYFKLYQTWTILFWLAGKWEIYRKKSTSFNIVYCFQSEPEVKGMFLFTIYKFFSYNYVHGDGEGK